MTELKNTAIWLGMIVLTIFVSFRALSAMQVHDDARIVLSKRVCPVALNDDGYCVVNGSLSRNFIFGEVELTLSDKSVLLLKREDILGYSTPVDSTRYEPFGKTFAFGLGVLILLAGFFFAVVVPAHRRRDDKTGSN